MRNYLNERPAKIVGDFLRSELKKRNLSQEDIAAEFGVDSRTVRRWTSAGINSLDTAWMVADYFDRSIGDILSSGDDVPCAVYKIMHKKREAFRTAFALLRFSFLCYNNI